MVTCNGCGGQGSTTVIETGRNGAMIYVSRTCTQCGGTGKRG